MAQAHMIPVIPLAAVFLARGFGAERARRRRGAPRKIPRCSS